MGSPVAPSEGLAGAQTLEEPWGEPGHPATGAVSGAEEPRVSGALPEGTREYAAEPWEGSRAVDVEGSLALESRSYTSSEVVQEVELGFPPYGSEAVGVEGSVGKEKIEDRGTPSGGDGRMVEKENGGGGGRGGELPAVVGVAEKPFLAGDFVWGKIKCHPWWPGQVYDSSDASEYAKKLRRRDQQCVLVAYFGDRTFAWCDPSQLRPFTEGFEKMARQSNTKNFAGALKEALDEIQRCLELETACACVPASAVAGLSGRRAANAGIKEAAAVPGGRVKELSIVHHVPAELLGRLHEIACDVSIAGLLEIVAIKGWFSAFDRWMGWHAGFPAEHRDEEVEDLVDVKAAAGAPIKGSAKSSHRKKVRSMAELIAETDMDMEVAEDGIDREKELATVERPAASPTARQRRKKNGEPKPSDAESADAGYEERAGSGRRERKRSKYLSPPYTTLIGGRGGHLPISPKDGEAMHPKKDVEASEAAESPGNGKAGSSFPTILKCNTEASRDKAAVAMFGGDGAPADEMLSELQSVALDAMYLKGNRSSSKVRIFFERFRSYSYTNVSDYGKGPGLQRDGHKEELKTDMDVKSSKSPVQEPDGSMELEGKPVPVMHSKTPDRSASASGHKSSTDRKKKSLGGDANDTKVAKSRGKRKSAAQEAGGPDKVKPGRKRNKEGEVINADSGAALLLTFAPGVPLPSKEQLISAFGKFGPLCEPETELLKDSGCGRVVFARSSDAERVFNSSDRDGALGPGVASCRLQYLHDSNLSITPPPPPGQKPQLHFVQKSLESMISALRGSSSPLREVAGASEELKPEGRENLVDEMDGLLKKVNKLLAGSATGAT